MSSPPATVVPLPGVEGYRLVELEIAQQERPDISDGAYIQWGAFQLVTTGAPARLLVIFDSKPGPLGWALPEMEKETYQLGVLGTRVSSTARRSFRVGHHCVQPNLRLLVPGVRRGPHCRLG